MAARRDYIPREYQNMLTSHFLEHPRTAGWSTMGTGKGVATLTALDALILAGDDAPTLVIGPLRVARDVWSDEAAKWAHLKDIIVSPMIGGEAERLVGLKRDASVYTVNFDNLPWLVEYWGTRWPYTKVVVDESTRLSGFRLRQGTAQAKALGSVAHTKVKRLIELTGTPAPNSLKKLWGQLWFLDAGHRLGRTYDSFTKRWFQRSMDGYGIEALDCAQEQIHQRIGDVCLSIDIKDYVELAEPIQVPIYVELPAAARTKYREMEKKLYTEIDGRSAEAFGGAAKTQKLLQLANGAIYVDPAADCDEHPKAKEFREVHDAKLQALESVVQEFDGVPLLVIYEFKSDLARLMRAYPKGVPLATREGMAAFKSGKAPMGFAHPKSVGHGVDGLQDVTNVAVLFGRNWDLELYDQVLGRIGPVRQMQSGHNRPVFIVDIMARDTVDEDVTERRAGKRSVQDILLDSLKRRST
jgi:SNF2-related domain